LITDFNAAITAILVNGHGQAGLEVGSDPGIPASQRVQIPASMRRAWRASYTDWAGAWAALNPNAVGPPPAQAAAAATIAAQANTDGWVTTGTLDVYMGQLWVAIGAHRFEVAHFEVAPPTREMFARFYTVNHALIGTPGATFDAAHADWAIAVRIWSVLAGFTTDSKSSEWVEVADPAAVTPEAEAWADYAITQAAESWTACAARVANWRKTNHATGGTPATGFARRWLAKAGRWSTDPDRDVAARHRRDATSAYYWAAHPAGCHAGLALMVPGDAHHFATVNPIYGLVTEWDVLESTRVRLVPRTQVAGTAIIVDAVTVLAAIVKEGLSPLVQNMHQLTALMTSYTTVRDEGMRVAVYSRWWFEDHPAGTDPVPFSQKDVSCAELASELAIIGTRYYAGSTIAQSAALINAAAQSSNEMARTTWTAIAAARRTASQAQITRTLTLIRGASSVANVAALSDPDVDVAAGAIAGFNADVTAHAAALAAANVAGVTNPALIDTARFRANHAALGAAAAPHP
jgi:hypothetical protein